MSKLSKTIYLFITTIFFVLLNSYITKFILTNSYKLHKNPVLEFLFIQNEGAAFNIFEGYKIFLIVFAIAAIIGIIFYTIKNIDKTSAVCLFFISILNAGIFNNMLERITLGYVRDFIKLNFIDFPIFNISDILINIGVLGIVFIILKNNYKSNRA